MVSDMENIYLSNNYKIDLERLEIYDSEGNTIEININKEGLKVVKLNWIFGLKEYPLALVVILTGLNPIYPLYVIENIVIGYKDNNKNNCYLSNLYYKFNGPVESKEVKGYYYIPFYYGYVINNVGDVIRLADNKQLTKSVRVFKNDKKNRKGGYVYYSMPRNTNKVKTGLRHRLLCLVFKDYHSDPALLVCNHINGVPGDDRLDNLELVTKAENNKHAIDNGLCPNSVVPVDYYNWITGVRKTFPSVRTASLSFTLGHSGILKRMTHPERRYSDGHCFRKQSEDKWNLEDRVFSMGVIKSVACKNVLTGQIIIADSSEAMSRLIGVNPISISRVAKANNFKPVKQFMFKFTTEEKDFPNLDLYKLEKIKKKYL